uniref:Uncharacterized protein n=1 Tax=Pipistrellus kuhlii TaxID=59472 RepID=A0A7J7VMF2_PIPKU|nr:hypothetical protein mPipKuh1_008400 [Pipistrellus kuhlii]
MHDILHFLCPWMFAVWSFSELERSLFLKLLTLSPCSLCSGRQIFVGFISSFPSLLSLSSLSLSLFFLIEFIGVTLVCRLYMFQVYNSTTRHLHTALCVPKQSLFPSPFPPFAHHHLAPMPLSLWL